MALKDYTLALLTAIQNGTAYFVPGKPVGVYGFGGAAPVVDKNGVTGMGTLHFPGEEKYDFAASGAKLTPSNGFPVQLDKTGIGARTVYNPNSGFRSMVPQYGGQDGALLNLQNIKFNPTTNKAIPVANPNDLVSVYASSGPSQLSQVLGAAVMSYLLPGAGTALAAELGITAAQGTALLTLGTQVAQGKDLGSALTNAALATAGSTVGSGVNSAVDSALSNLGSVGDTIGNIAGGTAAGIVSSGGKADPLALLQAGSLGAAVSGITSEIPGYDSLSAATKKAVDSAITAQLQGRDPTSALINAAMQAGKTAMATSTNVPTEEQVAGQRADFEKQFSEYLDTTPVAQDDGTTAGIQEVIDAIQSQPQDDGTTAGIQEVIDAIQSQPQDDGTTAGIQEVIDAIQSQPQDDGTTPVTPRPPTTPVTPKPPATPKTPTTPVTSKPPTTPTTPTPPTSGDQMDLMSLLSLLGASQQNQQAPTPPPVVEIEDDLSIDALLGGDLFAKRKTEPKMATGGSIDDLLALLQQRG